MRAFLLIRRLRAATHALSIDDALHRVWAGIT